MVPPKSKSKISISLDISLLKPPSPLYPLPINIIHYPIQKSPQNLPNLNIIQPTQSLFTIKLLYHF